MRQINFLFSGPSTQNPLNKVYPEDPKDIVEKFGHVALAGLQIREEGNKAQELKDVAEAAKKQIPHPVAMAERAACPWRPQIRAAVPASVTGRTPSESQICGCNSLFQKSNRFF